MGYAHGTQWNADLIEKGIKDVMRKARISCFPTHSLIKEVTGSNALSNAISKHGGSRYWAEKLGLEIKPCESKFGERFELLCMEKLQELGFKCEKMPVRYPYDLLVDDCIKVDVKSGNLCHGKTGDFYTFNLEKKNPTCDIFFCYCLEGKSIVKVYVIPSFILGGKKQLSIGKSKSKYDVFREDWDVFNEYTRFNNQFAKRFIKSGVLI